jgi:hypothetical protein
VKPENLLAALRPASINLAGEFLTRDDILPPACRCWALYAGAEECLKHQRKVSPPFSNQDGDSLLFGIIARSTKTYRALLYLCALGHGEQATMLGRALFEDALVATWIAANRSTAVTRAVDHERHTQHLWRETLGARGLDVGALGELPALSDEDRSRLRATFGAYGTRAWTGHSSLRALLTDIEDQWSDPNERTLVWWIHDMHLRTANLVLHNTSTSIVRPSTTVGGDLLFDSAASYEYLLSSMLLAFWAYFHVMVNVLRNGDRERLTTFYREQMPLFFSPQPKAPFEALCVNNFKSERPSDRTLAQRTVS